jgi:hypothetical protein
VFKVGCELAAACQPFGTVSLVAHHERISSLSTASKHLADSSFSIPKLISTSQTTKARLLHYFPPSPDAPAPAENEPVDSWCGFHLDHSVLTGLCSALYLRDGTDAVPAPSPSAGLYIKTRDGTLTQVKIPADCLAFQTGEALELATGGRLRATPHCVRAGGVGPDAHRISRETFGMLSSRCCGIVLIITQPCSCNLTHMFWSARTRHLVSSPSGSSRSIMRATRCNPSLQ